MGESMAGFTLRHRKERTLLNRALFRRRRWRPRLAAVVAATLLAGAALAATHIRVLSAPRATPLHLGERSGTARFPTGDTPNGGVGQRVDGLPCLGRASLGGTGLAHLTLVVFGEKVAIPAAIGVVPPRTSRRGLVAGGVCSYALHTIDASGLIETEGRTPPSLGSFFDIWGQPLSRSGAAGYAGPVRAYVGGSLYRGDPRSIRLVPGEQVTLEVGSTVVTPPVFSFPSGG